MRREADESYNAAEVNAVQNELIGGLDRERLDRTPWARSIVTKLIKRIAHLRARIAELESDKPSEDK